MDIQCKKKLSPWISKILDVSTLWNFSSRGTYINARNACEQTALKLAMLRGNTRTVEILLAHGVIEYRFPNVLLLIWVIPHFTVTTGQGAFKMT